MYKNFFLFFVLSSSLNAMEKPWTLDTYIAVLMASSYEEACQLLDEYKIDPNAIDPSDPIRDSLLTTAVFHENLPLVQALLDKGAYPNLADSHRDTALHYAAKKNNSDITSLLINRGSKINKKNKEGITSLEIASWWQGYCIRNGSGITRNNIITLLTNGADPNRGTRPSFLYLIDQDYKTIELFFTHGSSIEALYQKTSWFHGNSPLQSLYERKKDLKRLWFLQAIVRGLHKNNIRIKNAQKNTSLFDRTLVALAKSENVQKVASELMPTFPKKFSTDIQAREYLHSLRRPVKDNVPSLFNQTLSYLENSENVQEATSTVFQGFHPGFKNDEEAIAYLRSLYQGDKRNFDLALKRTIPIPPMSGHSEQHKEKILTTPSGVLLGALANLAR